MGRAGPWPASHCVMENLDDGVGMLAYTQELLKYSHAGQLTHRLVQKLAFEALHDRTPKEVEEDLRQHTVWPAVQGRSSRAPSPARPSLDLDHALPFFSLSARTGGEVLQHYRKLS
jgi:hypothetical protein